MSYNERQIIYVTRTTFILFITGLYNHHVEETYKVVYFWTPTEDHNRTWRQYIAKRCHNRSLHSLQQFRLHKKLHRIF